MEEFLYEKVQGKKPLRLVESDVLGQYMIDASTDMGSSAAYSRLPEQLLHVLVMIRVRVALTKTSWSRLIHGKLYYFLVYSTLQEKKDKGAILFCRA